jgi:hypothetical protein
MSDSKKSSIGGKTTCHLLNIKSPDKVAKRLKLKFQRTAAHVHVNSPDHQVEASLSVIDLSETSTGLFTSELLSKGSTVELTVVRPYDLKIKCMVAWSIPVQSGVQQRLFSFRSCLQFIFENEAQKTALQDFITKVNTDPMEVIRNAAPIATPSETAPAEPAPAAEAAAPVEGEILAEGASVTPISAAAEEPAAAPAEEPENQAA